MNLQGLAPAQMESLHELPVPGGEGLLQAHLRSKEMASREAAEKHAGGPLPRARPMWASRSSQASEAASA